MSRSESRSYYSDADRVNMISEQNLPDQSRERGLLNNDPLTGKHEPTSFVSRDVSIESIGGVDYSVKSGSLYKKLARSGAVCRFTPEQAPSTVFSSETSVDFEIPKCAVHVPKSCTFKYTVTNADASLDAFLSCPEQQITRIELMLNGSDVDITWYSLQMFEEQYMLNDRDTANIIAEKEGLHPYGRTVQVTPGDYVGARPLDALSTAPGAYASVDALVDMLRGESAADLALYASKGAQRQIRPIALLPDFSQYEAVTTGTSIAGNGRLVVPRSGSDVGDGAGKRIINMDLSFLPLFNDNIFWPAIEGTRPRIRIWFRATDGIFARTPAAWDQLTDRSKLSVSNYELWIKGDVIAPSMQATMYEMYKRHLFNTTVPTRDLISLTSLATGTRQDSTKEISSIFGALACLNMYLRYPGAEDTSQSTGQYAWGTNTGWNDFAGIRAATLFFSGGQALDLQDIPSDQLSTESDKQNAAPYLTALKQYAQVGTMDYAVDGNVTMTREPRALSWIFCDNLAQAKHAGVNSGQLVMDGSWTCQLTPGNDHAGNAFTGLPGGTLYISAHRYASIKYNGNLFIVDRL